MSQLKHFIVYKSFFESISKVTPGFNRHVDVEMDVLLCLLTL